MKVPQHDQFNETWIIGYRNGITQKQRHRRKNSNNEVKCIYLLG